VENKLIEFYLLMSFSVFFVQLENLYLVLEGNAVHSDLFLRCYPRQWKQKGATDPFGFRHS